MSPLAVPNATQASYTPSSTSAWHIGIPPSFPLFLVLSNNAAIEGMLTDIPFLSVGLLGFGVLTFFFAMRKFNRLSFFVFASVIMAFVASVLDVGQVLIRGRDATDFDTDVPSVLPLLVARELFLSVSIGIRFLFFWTFVSQPPRGECSLLSSSESQEQRPNFLWMESDIHSGSWARLDYVGGFLKYSLLLAVLVVTVLQILWRVVADFSKIGPVYDSDSTLEIAISALFVVKLFANAGLSPLTPCWKTIRDYSPVMVALLIGLGVGVGNILQFQFSETSLGRFLQAVELYILVLYVHLASFYHRRTRMSILDPTMHVRASEASKLVEGIKTPDQMSTLQINSTTTSTSRQVGGDMPHTGTLYSHPNNRLSPWLVPDRDATPIVSSTSRGMSIADTLSSWITGWRHLGRRDRAQSRLWAKKDVESGTHKAELLTLPETMQPHDATWKHTIHPPATPVMTPANQRLKRTTRALDSPFSNLRNGVVSPDGTISSFAVEHRSKKALPKIPNFPDTPSHAGLDGIVRYDGQPSAIGLPSRTQRNISSPIPRPSVERSRAYEHPRPAPPM